MPAWQRGGDEAAKRQRERRNRCRCTAPAALLVCFWLLGLINNSPYVICLALATEISSGGVGLVYLSAILPTIVVKGTVSLWYHAVPPAVRMALVAALMSGAYALIAFGGSLGAQLAGVALVALQGGLGEATVLALCARFPPVDASLTAWSSGTGFAGVFGYVWVALFRVYLRLSFRDTLLLANALPLAWLAAYFLGLRARRPPSGGRSDAGGGEDAVGYGLVATTGGDSPSIISIGEYSPQRLAARSRSKQRVNSAISGVSSGSSSTRQVMGGGTGAAAAAAAAAADPECPDAEARRGSRRTVQKLGGGDAGSPRGRLRVGGGGGGGSARDLTAASDGSPRNQPGGSPSSASQQQGGLSIEAGDQGSEGCEGDELDPRAMSLGQRLGATLALWPYTVPLFVVYAAEYTMQSGVWSAIGFPVTSKEARKQFYLYSNWSYQVAVFISRSSGTLITIGRRGLWAMPALQCVLLAFFVTVAALRWLYGWGLLVLCFVAGLLGGATYVHAFTLLSREVPPASREFSLAAACLADSLGIAVADAVAVFLQGCLMRVNGIASQAVFKCGA